MFYVPEFAPGPLLLKLSGLNSTESEVATKKLLFLGRLITEPKMTPFINNLFDSRTKSFFDSDISSLGVPPSTAESLKKFDLFITLKHGITTPFSQHTQTGKILQENILHFEKSARHSYCDTHPEMQIASSCLANVTPFHFWSLADHFPDLVSRLHVQIRLMGQFVLSGGIPWLRDSDGAFCFVCKHDIESVTDCSYFKQNFLSLWRNLKLKVTVSNQADGLNICQLIDTFRSSSQGTFASRGPLFTIRQCNM